MESIVRKKGQALWVIAHRGYSAEYPENTLRAFEEALRVGVDMIEFDVALTLDRKLVVIHDAVLSRTTDGKGKVHQRSLEQLKKYDAGAWFDPKFAGERVPTLEEVLDLLGGRVLLNLEIKPETFEAQSSGDSIENQVVDLIKERNLYDSMIVSSFNHKFLRNIASHDPRVHLGMLYTRNFDPEEIAAKSAHHGMYSFHVSRECLAGAQVAQVHELGLYALCYTVNEEALMKEMLTWGVDGIFTDDPPLLQQVIQQCGGEQSS